MDFRAIAMGVAFAVMWSSAFTSARVIVEYAPPLSALALRFLISGLLGVAIAWALGQSAQLNARQWKAVLIFGICQNALYLGLNFVAMQTIQASLAAIIASTMPLLVALAGWLVYLLSPILTPFLVSALLAYLGDPLVDRLEARGLKRTPSVAVTSMSGLAAAIRARVSSTPWLLG